uniref:Uncharacterized protein n=1 Tax=Rhizophora mucronata TaxID=61149 RepID=A0A2P2PZN5_RHIMU
MFQFLKLIRTFFNVCEIFVIFIEIILPSFFSFTFRNESRGLWSTFIS